MAPHSKDLLKNFFENAEIQQNIKQIIRPLGYLLYDHFYPYIWLICLYNVVLIFLVVFILFLLIGDSKSLIKSTL